MVELSLRYVVMDVDRHGNTRYYFRKKGFPKVRLRGIPGSREFMDAYNDALTNHVGTIRIAPKDPNSFEFLCNSYFRSPTFRGLSSSTQSWRHRELQQISNQHGTKPFARLTASNVRRLIEEKSDLPGAARNRLKALKALFRWALDHELVKSDPTDSVRPIQYNSEGHHTWTDEEVSTFESHFPLGAKPRLALSLLLYTACRRGDVVRLGPQNLQFGRLKYRQSKNANKHPVDIDVPVHPELEKAINSTATGPFTFLITEFGRPFSVAGFGNRFREWCNQAGLPHCSAHGLRKAAATRLAEAGASPHEIMAVTGHRTLSEVERYTAAANNRNLADAAIAKIK